MPAEGDSADIPNLGRRVPLGGIRDGAAILDRFLAWVQASGLEPYPAQEEALLELMTGRHVILSTPTGSGKSLVALGLHFKAMCEERRSFYTAPIKALASEKFFDLCRHFGAENVGMLTGDASINWAAPIICCTAEVLANMAVRQGEEADAPYVVMDEFHYYADRDRGSAWQIPLIRLRRSRFLLMSATLGDTSAIERHLKAASGREVARVHSDDRPVPLDYAYVETPLHETVETLLRQQRAPIYIVHFTQREAAEEAQALTSAQITDRDQKRAIADALVGVRFDSPYGKDMQRFLRHGIGLHHAAILPKYRLLVERLAQQGLLRVICGTDTLGVGVNIPIRSVLFSKLCKYDGEKTALLSVRDFKQISGRAGRKGFDVAGSVVAQAPEHVIENKRLEAKASGSSDGRKRKIVKKKPPPRGFVPWTEDTLTRLIHSPPETLVSHFRVTHGLLVGCLQSEHASHETGGGWKTLVDLIAGCHEEPARKRQLLREAAVLLRSLRRAGLVDLVKDTRTGRPTLRVGEDLQRDFSLHHSLSLYLVEAAAVLDPQAPSYALDLLALVEAVLEDPRPILQQQAHAARGELIAQLKAEGVPYEERMEKLDEVSWPKPCADFIYASFNLFAERHPWVGSENIRPKGIARELYELYSGFDDYVRRLGLARVEGLLLRYLGQVHDSLSRSLPAALRSEEVEDMIGYFRALVARVDSSLVEEWQSLTRPPAASEVAERAPRPYDLAADTRALRARVRSECHALVRALAARSWAEASELVQATAGDAWDAARFEAEMAGFHAAHERILVDPRSRRADLCVLHALAPRHFEVHQVLLDPEGDDDWSFEAEIDLREDPNPSGPLLRMRRIGV
jgi:Domain of unknown function (DUF3516)/DEAD/DEAH box helicase